MSQTEPTHEELSGRLARSEEELVHADEMLEQRVRDRTVELSDEVGGLQGEIARRQLAEGQLGAAARYARSLIEASPDPLLAVSLEGRITDVNEAAVRATGVARDGLVGGDFWDCFTEPAKAREGHRWVIAKGALRDYPLTIQHVSGGTTDVLYNAAPYFNEKGQTQGVFVAVRDVTERRRAEARADESARVLALRAEQLRALATELVGAEQRERTRLARVIHDHLQQLLVAAKFSIGALRGRVRTKIQQRTVEQVAEILDEAIRSARSLTAELSPPVLHEKGLAAGLEWLARQMREKHNLTVDVAADGEAELEAEQVRVLLFEAVRELLFNVVKHAGADRATVRMNRLGDDRIEVTVADEGAGFDAAAMGDGASVGGGFGLFSIRERLQYLGGRMDIESAPGRGSRFRLVAPMRLASPGKEIPMISAKAPSAAAVAEPGGVLFSAGRKTRILLVDDHPVMRQGLARLLEDYPDIEVVGEAGDGQSAVELAGHLHPDVILMDVTMPGMNGLEATRRIVGRLPQVRVIGLSMHEEADMAAGMRRAGAVAYFTKGGPTDDLIAAIRAKPQA